MYMYNHVYVNKMLCYSLVAADLAFYKNHLKCMVGLAQIVDNMEEIWDKG